LTVKPIEITLLRPLLDEARSNIDAYLAAAGLSPIEDQSNSSLGFDRNWVRHEVLPQLQARWPAAIESIQRSSRAMAHDREMLDTITHDAFAAASRNDRTLCTDSILILDRAIAYRVLRMWLSTISNEEIGFDTVESIYELMLSNVETRSIEVGGGHRVVSDRGRLTTLDILSREVGSALPLRVDRFDDEWIVQLLPSLGPGDARVDAPIDSNLTVRTVKAGDTWFGTNRSVTDDLRAAGIHPLMRQKVLAVACDGGVLLIPAIYPTIPAVIGDRECTKVGVRWGKRA
jgi:hypothetical protein